MSPEAGLRRLVHDSVETVLIPVDNTVRRVHQVLMEASRCVTQPSTAPFAYVPTAMGVCLVFTVEGAHTVLSTTEDVYVSKNTAP